MISIITPSYNSEEYLEECILSIKNQNFKEYEHIIVDGGSKDRTLDIIKKYEGTYPMRWISEKDNGMYDAISKGFKMAKGDIFCWLNSDDMYMPWTLATVDAVFKRKEISWCIGNPVQFDENGTLYFIADKLITFPREVIAKGWMDGRRVGCVQQESSFWRKSLYEKVEGIDCKYKLAGDYALWVKFAQHEKLWSLNTVLGGFRVHAGQKSENKHAYFKEIGELSTLQKLAVKCKYYKIRNKFLKRKEHVINVRGIVK